MKDLQVSQKSEWRKILQSAAFSHMPYAICHMYVCHIWHIWHICILCRGGWQYFKGGECVICVSPRFIGPAIGFASEPNFFLMGFPCYLSEGRPQINRTSSSINGVSTFCVGHSSIEPDMCIMPT